MKQYSRRGLWIVVLTAGLAGMLAAGAGARWLESRRKHAVPILMYHRIGEPRDQWWVSAEEFAAHLACLREQGYRTVLPSDLAAHRRRGRPLPRRPVVITFDDGYRNLLELAEPLLKQSGFQAVAYLATDFIADNDTARRDFQGVPCLTWEEVRRMQERGTVVFGGHSRSHRNLAAPHPIDEVEGCAEDLRRRGRLDPDSFCYPSGQSGDTVVREVRGAGFPAAVICGDAVAHTGPTMDRYRLPRVSVMGGPKAFALRLAEATADEDRQGVVIAYEGVPMTVWLRRSDGNDPDGGAWHGPLELGRRTEAVLPWPPATEPSDRGSVFEVWDRHRVLRLWRTPWPSPETAAP